AYLRNGFLAKSERILYKLVLVIFHSPFLYQNQIMQYLMENRRMDDQEQYGETLPPHSQLHPFIRYQTPLTMLKHWRLEIRCNKNRIYLDAIDYL
ncbi:hypothetical protein L9F63_017649, partial [Diploptera punctata]